MSRRLFAFVLCLAFVASARADLDAELNQPYRLRIALHVAPHPDLTDTFKKNVKLHLHDILQEAFAALTEVEILDLDAPDAAREPLLQKALGKGLQSLDGPQDVNDVKTHFVFIDFANGQYEITARQHDGTSGLTSPVVRRETTTDRDLVVRTAALMVSQDFGIVGTVPAGTTGPDVLVPLKGGGLGVPLGRWVQKDEVFALSGISPAAGGRKALVVPWALLRVVKEPENGSVACQFVHRFGNPLPAAGMLGYRCLKLGTVTAPLKLRLVSDDKDATPHNGLQVFVSRTGFGDQVVEQSATNADGVVRFREKYQHAAFVQVKQFNNPVANLPIEIVGDRVVVCRVNIQKGGEQIGQFHLRVNRWRKHINSSMDEDNELVRELKVLVDKSRKDAMAKARAGVLALRTAVDSLTEEMAALKKTAKTLNVTFDLGDSELRIDDLRDRREKLDRWVKDLEEIEKKVADPRRQQWQAQLKEAELAEDRADYESALETYRKVLREMADVKLDDNSVRTRLDNLEKKWEIKDDAQREARDFVYKKWANLQEAAQMKEYLGDARKFAGILKDHGDTLTLRKLLKASEQLALKLASEEEKLQPDINDDDKRKSNIIEQVAKDLQDLLKRVEGALKVPK